MSWYRFQWPRYVSVGERMESARREVEKLRKKGREITPIRVEGRKIADTFWGKAWCANLENYSDFSNRLPRGRSYLRNGSVVDLKILPGRVTALVAGSSLYTIGIDIDPLSKAHWKELRGRCAGRIGSMIDLLKGRLSDQVMGIMTDPAGGLFPRPAQIKLSCSCPDWADMCKHVAATLYGVGARLDTNPELLFVLRKTDHMELIEAAGDVKGLVKTAPKGRKTIASADLAEVFNVDIEAPAASAKPRVSVTVTAPQVKRRAAARPAAKARKPARKKKLAKPAATAR